MAGTWILRLYPRAWRERYEMEVLDLLSARPIDRRAGLDLLRGALDAHMHPFQPTRWPALAALVGGAAWTMAAVNGVLQPVPPDWPGYLIEILPLAVVGVAALLLALIGAWLRLGDGADGLARIAVDLAVAGHAAWFVALIAAMLGIDYGLSTVIASSAAAFGAVAVGACLIRAGEDRLGALLVLTSVTLLITAPVAWLALGLGWTAIGWLQLSRPERRPA